MASERRLAAVVLSRMIAASGTPGRRKLPRTAADLYGSALGLATLSYLPYAVFDVTSPLLALVGAGSRMPRRGKAAQASRSQRRRCQTPSASRGSQLNEPVCSRAFSGGGLSRMQCRAQALLLLV